MTDQIMDPEADATDRDSPTIWIAYLPVIALIAIATLQFATAQNSVLTPWKGGGFGMFSTVDVDTSRTVALYLDIDGREYPAAIPSVFSSDIASFRPMPTTSRTEALAHHLLNQTWVELPDHRPPDLVALADVTEPAVPGYFTLKHPLHDPASVVELDGIRIQVWAREFVVDRDTGGGELHRHKIQDVYVAHGDAH